jgi:hypothetical protein
MANDFEEMTKISCMQGEEVHPHGTNRCDDDKCMQCIDGQWVETGSPKAINNRGLS